MAERERKSVYEKERERNIERNRLVLASLGLSGVSLATVKKSVCDRGNAAESYKRPLSVNDMDSAAKPLAQVREEEKGEVCQRDERTH